MVASCKLCGKFMGSVGLSVVSFILAFGYCGF